jgi:hypothetical protein
MCDLRKFYSRMIQWLERTELYSLPSQISTIISLFQKTSFMEIVEHLFLISWLIFLFPVAPNLEHRTSVKRFFSLQFLNPKTVGRTPWMVDQPVARPLPIQTQNKHRQTFIPWVGFESTIPAFELAKTFHALDRAATVIGLLTHKNDTFFSDLHRGLLGKFPYKHTEKWSLFSSESIKTRIFPGCY